MDKPEGTQDLREITRIIGPMLFERTHEIFKAFRMPLTNMDEKFIVRAVWGENDADSQPLAPDQVLIHEEVELLLAEITGVLALKDLSPPQEFAISFLLRTITTLKLCLATEQFRHLIYISLAEDKASDLLSAFKTLGEA